MQQLVGYSNSYSYPYGCYNDYIKKCVAKHYRYAFSVTQGGTNLKTDDLQVRRYFISEIYVVNAHSIMYIGRKCEKGFGYI